jgi:hypothetical protein
MRPFRQNDAEWVADEGCAPEFEGFVGGAFKADAVYRGYVDSVCDGVGALDGLPGIVLRFAVFGFFGRVPADGGGVEEDICAG